MSREYTSDVHCVNCLKIMNNRTGYFVKASDVFDKQILNIEGVKEGDVYVCLPCVKTCDHPNKYGWLRPDNGYFICGWCGKMESVSGLIYEPALNVCSGCEEPYKDKEGMEIKPVVGKSLAVEAEVVVTCNDVILDAVKRFVSWWVVRGDVGYWGWPKKLTFSSSRWVNGKVEVVFRKVSNYGELGLGYDVYQLQEKKVYMGFVAVGPDHPGEGVRYYFVHREQYGGDIVNGVCDGKGTVDDMFKHFVLWWLNEHQGERWPLRLEFVFSNCYEYVRFEGVFYADNGNSKRRGYEKKMDFVYDISMERGNKFDLNHKYVDVDRLQIWPVVVQENRLRRIKGEAPLVDSIRGMDTSVVKEVAEEYTVPEVFPELSLGESNRKWGKYLDMVNEDMIKSMGVPAKYLGYGSMYTREDVDKYLKLPASQWPRSAWSNETRDYRWEQLQAVKRRLFKVLTTEAAKRKVARLSRLEEALELDKLIGTVVVFKCVVCGLNNAMLGVNSCERCTSPPGDKDDKGVIVPTRHKEKGCKGSPCR